MTSKIKFFYKFVNKEATMKILVTGAKGFVGKNFVASLKNIKEGKDRTRSVVIDEIYEYDLGDEDKLDSYCKDCDFVFNLAGVNRLYFHFLWHNQRKALHQLIYFYRNHFLHIYQLMLLELKKTTLLHIYYYTFSKYLIMYLQTQSFLS